MRPSPQSERGRRPSLNSNARLAHFQTIEESGKAWQLEGLVDTEREESPLHLWEGLATEKGQSSPGQSAGVLA